MNALLTNKNKRQWPTGGRDALDTAFRLLTRRDHTRRELQVKLRRKGFGAGEVERAVARLDELGYLDDLKTARILAGHLVQKGYGALRIRYALGQKGLDEAIVEKALDGCGDDRTQAIDARRVLKKKRQRLEREADPKKRLHMAYRFLAGRGFPTTVIRRVLGDWDGDFDLIFEDPI